MAIPRTRHGALGRASANELDPRVVDAAAMFYEREMSLEAISGELNVSVSSVSRLLNKARNAGLVRVQYAPPLVLGLAEQLLDAVRKSDPDTALTEVFVVPAGSGRNERLLGAEAAKHTHRALMKTQDTPRLTMSCGTVLWSMAKELARCLQDERPAEVIESSPASWYPKDWLNPLYPQSLVTALSVMLRTDVSADDSPLNVGLQTLPGDYYSCDDEKRSQYKNIFDVAGMKERAAEANVFAVGIGAIGDPDYEQIVENLHIDKDKVANFAGEVAYHPIDAHGQPSKDVAEKLVGVDIDQLRTAARDETKTVIAIGGGTGSGSAVFASLANASYDILVTDVTAARHCLDLFRASLDYSI